jgi:catechol 2,3-dioxygenase-like lactoylglutathione lyase family enzyme
MMANGSTADGGFRLGTIGQIARHVSDIDRAVAFYGGVLGLPHLYTYGDLAFFDCAGTRLFLSGAQDGSASAAQSIIYFRVPDIDAAHAELTARGVTFEGAPHMIHRHADGVEEWMAFFTDPDGGLLAIMAQTPATA